MQLTVTKSRNRNDCWCVGITEWTGIPYEKVYQTARESNLIVNGGFSNTEKVLEALGLNPEVINDDGMDGIIRLRTHIGGHIVIRIFGELLDTTGLYRTNMHNSSLLIVGMQRIKV